MRGVFLGNFQRINSLPWLHLNNVVSGRSGALSRSKLTRDPADFEIVMALVGSSLKSSLLYRSYD